MAERKMRYAVLSYFEKSIPVGNKAKHQWDADGLLESYSYDQIKEVIDWYVRVAKNPSWTQFLYNFDEYKNARIDHIKDIETRRRNIQRVKGWIESE